MLRYLYKNRSLIAVALLAVCVLLLSPLLLIGHDHGDGPSDEHCAICVWASAVALVEHFDATPPSTVERCITVPSSETALSQHSSRPDNPRAPPTA